MTTTYEFDTADTLDTRDIIERVEDLETECDGIGEEECAELVFLRAILDDLKGYGGDEQWRGDWYPVTLIREDYFTEYAQEMLEDCGTIPRDLPHWVHIDWEATAREVKVDYSEVTIDGVTYFYR